MLQRLNDAICREHGLSVTERKERNGKPVPKVARLSDKYASLLAEKQSEYERYKQYRQDMITYEMMKQNVDRILGTNLTQQRRKRQIER